jgi:hypothetical protein
VDFADLSSFLPLRADLFGVRHGSGRTVRRAARIRNGCMAVAALSSFLPRWIGSGGENCGDSHIFAKSANDGALTLMDMPPPQAVGPAFNFYEEMMS